MVNIDFETRKDIVERMDRKQIAPDMFHQAAVSIFAMVDRDVYRRFVTSDNYKEMFEPVGGASKPGAARAKRRHSFAVVPMEEKYTELDSIAESFALSGHVKDRRYHLKKYHLCFKGCRLADWLIERGYTKNRAGAAAIAQRMYDANVIRHVVDEKEFEDTDQLYTLQNKTALQSNHSPLELCGREKCFTGDLLLKGVHYMRVFAVLALESKKLYLFRHNLAKEPIMKIKLKGTKYKSFTQTPEDQLSSDEFALLDASARNRGATASGARGEKAAAPAAPTVSAAREPREPICYLQLDTPSRSLDFRVDSVASFHEWATRLAQLGVTPMSGAQTEEGEADAGGVVRHRKDSSMH